MNRLRWGVLGRRGNRDTQSHSRDAERGVSTVTAIASRSGEKARTAADELGIAKAYGSYDDLLHDPDVDAIYNPLPNHLHVPWTKRAAEAGKHVLCEKPIALSPRRRGSCIEVRDRTGVQIQEAFMVRSHPQWLLARSLIRDGRIGELRVDRRVQLLQRRSREHPQRARVGRRRADGHRLLSDQHLAVSAGARTGAGERRDRPRSGAEDRSADVAAARLRRRAPGRHLQHADGLLPAHAGFRIDGVDRHPDSVQRPARSAVRDRDRQREGSDSAAARRC